MHNFYNIEQIVGMLFLGFLNLDLWNWYVTSCVDCVFQISLKNDILGTKTNGNKYAYTRIIHIWPSMCAPVRVLGGGNSYLNSVLVLWLLVLLESCCVWCSFVTSGEELWLPIQQHFILTSTWLLNCRITWRLKRAPHFSKPWSTKRSN